MTLVVRPPEPFGSRSRGVRSGSGPWLSSNEASLESHPKSLSLGPALRQGYPSADKCPLLCLDRTKGRGMLTPHGGRVRWSNQPSVRQLGFQLG